MAKLIQGIKVEKIGYGGIGLARMSDGKRILIKGGALPGAVVDLRVVKQRKDYIEAHITKIHKYDPALLDGKIFCPHFFSMIGNEENSAGLAKWLWLM
ncbi:MAG: TRAM domain-containing protein [candidate division SR1 bacterium]|nr:TRAM domain-containing protein [candidate division SR1 bacterium]